MITKRKFVHIITYLFLLTYDLSTTWFFKIITYNNIINISLLSMGSRRRQMCHSRTRCRIHIRIMDIHGLSTSNMLSTNIQDCRLDNWQDKPMANIRLMVQKPQLRTANTIKRLIWISWSVIYSDCKVSISGYYSKRIFSIESSQNNEVFLYQYAGGY